MNHKAVIPMLVLLVTSGDVLASDTRNLCQQRELPPNPFSLPADDAPKQTPDNPLDLWFWNGHLYTRAGHRYDYSVFIVRFSFGPGNHALWGQAALSDVRTGQYHQSSTFVPGLFPETVDGFDLSFPVTGAPSASGGGGVDHITAAFPGGISLDLRMTSVKNPLILFGNGWAQFVNPETGVVAGDNFYYSRPRMLTSGTLTIDGVEHPVTGQGWSDRQWHACCFGGPVAWDWYGIQLEDGSEYTVYDIYVPGRRELVMSRTVTVQERPPGCAQRTLSQEEFVLGHDGAWTSPHSGNVYPTRFSLDIPGEGTHLEVTPVFLDQETTQLPDFFAPWYLGGANVRGVKNGRPVRGVATLDLFGYPPVSR